MVLALTAAEPDLTLEEIRSRLRQRGIVVSATSVWRFYDRHAISFKKACAPPSKTAKTSVWRVRTGDKNSRGLIRANSSSSTRPGPRPT
jgi:transposase